MNTTTQLQHARSLESIGAKARATLIQRNSITPERAEVSRDYSSLIHQVFPHSNIPKVFITLHLAPEHLRLSGTSKAPCELGRAYLRAYAKAPTAALHSLIRKFNTELSRASLKSLSRRHGVSLRSITSLENDGKAFNSTAPLTHAHIITEMPKAMTHDEFAHITREVFERTVTPYRATEFLNIQDAKDDDALTEYLLKQSLTFNTASDRILFHVPKTPIKQA
jgi:hypothetical protein